MTDSKIEWTDDTWNPWIGCKKVSAECKFCYMYREWGGRFGKNPERIVRSKTKFNYPLTLKEPRKIFTCSWSDFFIEQADEWRAEAWEVIRKTPQHSYQILTKRPERIAANLPEFWKELSHVRIGVSVGNQEAVHRIDTLNATNFPSTFVSFEPLLGPILLPEALAETVQWAIIGGESGFKNGKFRYRPCETEWITGLIDQLKPHKAAVFVKQVGNHIADANGMVAKHGGNPAEWPEGIRIRQYPN